MQNLKHIKSFKFDYARYNLSDGLGDDVVLQVNYKDNNYVVKSKSKSKNRKFRTEIDQIASELLRKKHAVDFAKSKNTH